MLRRLRGILSLFNCDVMLKIMKVCNFVHDNRYFTLCNHKNESSKISLFLICKDSSMGLSTLTNYTAVPSKFV